MAMRDNLTARQRYMAVDPELYRGDEDDEPANLLAAVHPNPGRHAAELAEHLVDLIEFHRDDSDDVQHDDPIERIDPSGAYAGNPSTFRVTCRSGRRFMVIVSEEPRT